MPAFDEVGYYFGKAARVMDLSAQVERMLITPYREAKVDVSITFRTAAFIVAIGRVAKATVLRGV